MMRRPFPLLALAAIGVQTCAGYPYVGGLFRRQRAIDIPVGCESQCRSINATLSTCQAIPCLCNDDVGKALVTCLNCDLRVNGATEVNLQEAAVVVQQYLSGCADNNVILSPLVLQGGQLTTTIIPFSTASPIRPITSIIDPSFAPSTTASPNTGNPWLTGASQNAGTTDFTPTTTFDTNGGGFFSTPVVVTATVTAQTSGARSGRRLGCRVWVPLSGAVASIAGLVLLDAVG